MICAWRKGYVAHRERGFYHEKEDCNRRNPGGCHSSCGGDFDFYKQGFEYFVKMKVELDNYIENQFNPTSGFMYP